MTNKEAIAYIKKYCYGEWCEDEWREAMDMAISALKAQEDGDTINRKAAIDAMEGVNWYHIDSDGQLTHGANSEEDEPLYKAKDVYAVLNKMPSAQPEPPWIPCSKELPKIGDRVIGTYKNSLFENGPYVVRVMHREKKYWVGDDEHWFLYENIIAWMPLPEPYQEDI